MRKSLVLDLILKLKKGRKNSVNTSHVKGKDFLIKINSNKRKAACSGILFCYSHRALSNINITVLPCRKVYIWKHRNLISTLGKPPVQRMRWLLNSPHIFKSRLFNALELLTVQNFPVAKLNGIHEHNVDHAVSATCICEQRLRCRRRIKLFATVANQRAVGKFLITRMSLDSERDLRWSFQVFQVVIEKNLVLQIVFRMIV